MNNDRELLTLAAKAARFSYRPEVLRTQKGLLGCFLDDPEQTEYWWNPLTDDGDALRLAVKLGFLVTNRFGYAEVVVPATHGKSGFVEADKGDPYAATRRAIVRAAAEIGRSMK